MSDDRLKLVREISRSGVATVWEGWDSSLDRKVLVKAIHPQYARDADLRIRFEREARAIARLSHPNVVQIYDIQSGADSLSLFLEFVEGETLGSLLKRRGALPVDISLRITIDVLSGLEQAHSGGIVHRDLKPDNILIASNGAIKITDFGLASLRDLPGVTMDGMVVGTPSYMAPEQALGSETSAQTDLFTCGAMLFEMLTGSRLIAGESLGEAFQNVIKYRPPDLKHFEKLIPESVLPVLEMLLERDPSRRPESAASVKHFLLTRTEFHPADIFALADFVSGTERVQPATDILLKARRHSKYWAIAGSVFLVILLIGLWSLVRDDKQTVVTKPTIPTPSDSSSTVPAIPLDTSTTKPPTDTTGDTVSATRPRPTPRDTSTARTPLTPPIEVGPAYATFTSTPWARVFYNDSLLGTTPILQPVKLPSGRGTLLLLNDEIKLPVSRQLELKANDTTEIAVSLQDFVARLKIASVRPWADVYVDGVLKFRTPSTQVIYLPVGRHTLELRHPELPTYTKDLDFQPRDPIFEVRVDLTKQ
ncbi:MAG: protein kinase [bacterium]|nr:protein kinase [bacterium]